MNCLKQWNLSGKVLNSVAYMNEQKYVIKKRELSILKYSAVSAMNDIIRYVQYRLHSAVDLLRKICIASVEYQGTNE